MKKIIIKSLISMTFIMVLTSCKSEIISNPYTYGTGHHAGFEWAQSNDVSHCTGNNSSFIGGCEEYIKQRNQ